MDFKRAYPHLTRKPNRREPAERIRAKCDVVRWHDTDTFTFDHLTRAEAERLFRLALHDVHLYGLCHALGTMLGYDMEVIAA